MRKKKSQVPRKMNDEFFEYEYIMDDHLFDSQTIQSIRTSLIVAVAVIISFRY